MNQSHSSYLKFLNALSRNNVKCFFKVKCSFRLPNTNCDNEDTDELETVDSAGEAPIFNFQKQWEITEVTNEVPEGFC